MLLKMMVKHWNLLLLKNNKEIVITALKQNKMSFAYIGENIKEEYFDKEKNYSAESIEFQLVKPWERLEKNDLESNAWVEKINNGKDNQWER